MAVPHVPDVVAVLVNVPAEQTLSIGLPLVDGVVVSVHCVIAVRPVVALIVHPVSTVGHEFGHSTLEPLPVE